MAHHKTVVCWISFVVVFAASSARPQARGLQYATAQKFSLRQEGGDTGCSLQLLIDTRLSESVQKELWRKGDWRFVFPSDSSLYRDFSIRPPIKSRLCIIDSARKLVAERELEEPLAKLQLLNSNVESSQLFLLTQDHSVGFGSYNGLVTTLLTVADSTFHDIKALDLGSHQERPVQMMKSLKSDWRLVQQERGLEILSVSCHLDRSGQFVINYIRYSFDGKAWVEYKHQMAGIWESDEAFPDASVFR